MKPSLQHYSVPQSIAFPKNIIALTNLQAIYAMLTHALLRDD